MGTKSDFIRLISWREKMHCAEIRKLISLYIDDRLSPDEKEAFSSHTRNCSGCQEALEEARAVHELFASAERFSAPYGFTTRVLANLETESLFPVVGCFYPSAFDSAGHGIGLRFDRHRFRPFLRQFIGPRAGPSPTACGRSGIFFSGSVSGHPP